MIVIRHELRQGKTSFWIWTASIGFLLAVCIFLFPEMKREMEGISRLFSAMGAFTAAFGMDRLDFGTLTGFYAIECGNILGLGGAFYAALTASAILSKEENGRTAEFLLTHPISRMRIITEKLLAVFLQITALNAVIYLISAGSITAVGESVPWKELSLLHAAYYLLQLELAGICFGVSAYAKRGDAGIGLGIAAAAYCLNLVANIAPNVPFIKYVTPFGYCEGADIVAEGVLDARRIAVGMAIGAAAIFLAYRRYGKKDISVN